jgi:hypothetical protein
MSGFGAAHDSVAVDSRAIELSIRGRWCLRR